MSYSSRRGRRPDEFASKSSHSHIINDPAVKDFLSRCSLPKRSEDITLPPDKICSLESLDRNPIKHVVAIDGGYSEIVIQPEFPSATIAFFQFGALIFSAMDLRDLEEQPFINPKDMAKLKNIKRLKLTLPISNISFDETSTITHSVRSALYDFFMSDLDGRNLMDALSWLIFEQYRPTAQWVSWNLASCPYCKAPNISLSPTTMRRNYKFECPQCTEAIYLSDVLRLHEAIDDELGASGILGYITTAIEQILLVFVIKLLLETRPTILREVLFIKDGPLAFFGQTANLHKPMRKLTGYLFNKHALFLAGLEKSGIFVEHAHEIAKRLEPGTFLILDNDYIYQYILPGRADSSNPYGRTTYYGNKLIYKTSLGSLYLVTLPTQDLLAHPERSDFNNVDVILHNLTFLKCDMYDSALLPVALVNKLVSLADHPSSAILQTFATNSLRR